MSNAGVSLFGEPRILLNVKAFLILLICVLVSTTCSAQYRGGSGQGIHTAAALSLSLAIPNTMNSGGADDGIGAATGLAKSLSITNTIYSGGSDDGISSALVSSVPLAAASQFSGGNDDGTGTLLASSLALATTSMFVGGADDGFNSNSAASLSLGATSNYAGGADDGFNANVATGLSLGIVTIYAGGTDDGASGLLSSGLNLSTNTMFAGGVNDGVSSIAASTLDIASSGMYAGGLDDGYGSAKATAISIVMLPITWEEFSVARNGADAQLYWKVGTERNDAGFDIERSYDGFHFSKIGFVKAKNSILSENEYSYTDYEPQHFCASVNCTEVFYRLRQIDIDQNFSFSPIRKLKLGISPMIASIYPNPATKQLFVRINSFSGSSLSYDLQLYNNMGMLVFQQKQVNNNLFEINVQEFASGIYYLKLSIDGHIYPYQITFTH